MATVPVYSRQAVQSETLRPTTGAPTAGLAAQQVGEGLQRSASGIGQIAREMQNELDQTRVMDAMNQFVAARNASQIKALSLEGRNALERPDGKSLVDEFGGDLDTQRQGLRDTLGNDTQKLMFDRASMADLNAYKAQLGAHVVQQSKVYQAGVYKSTVEVAQNQAALLWSDPKMREQSTGAIAAAVDKQAALAGWSPEQKQAALTDAMSPMHMGVLKGMLQGGQAEAAQEYLSNNSASMTLQARAQAQDMLKGASSLQRAQGFADEVMGKGMSMADALSLARSKFSGDDEVAAVHEVRTRFAENDAARAQNVKQVVTSSWSALMERGSMSAIPPDVMASLRRDAPEEERQMRDWLEAKWRRAKADAEGKNAGDFERYYGLRRMAMDEPQAFAALDLRKAQPYLSKAQLESLTDIQGGIAKGDAKAMESQRVVKSTLEMVRSQVLAAGIDLTPKEGTQQAKETAQFMSALTSSLDDATKAKGAPLTPDEAKRIGLSMVREGVEQGSGIFGMFQSKKLGYQIATDPNIKPGASFVASRYADIPKQVRDSLAAEYRQRNGLGTRPLSSDDEAAIERAYTRGVQAGRFSTR